MGCRNGIPDKSNCALYLFGSRSNSDTLTKINQEDPGRSECLGRDAKETSGERHDVCCFGAVPKHSHKNKIPGLT